MRNKILLSLVFASALLAGCKPSGRDWQKIDAGTAGQSFYDKNSIKRDGNRVKVEMVHQPNAGGRSLLTVAEFLCDQQSWRVTRVAMYSDSMAQGQVLSDQPTQPPFTPTRQRDGRNTYEALCGNK